MTPPRRNEFLEASESEDDAIQDYPSDDDGLAKGGRSAKRRKIRRESDGENEAEENDAAAEQAQPPPKTASALPDVTKPLTKKNLVASDKAVKKSGVIFLSRIPPFMKPAKLRSLLEPYGTINRIFLAPEEDAAHSRRVRAGGNKKRLYTEGWVEFVDKKNAKAACELLNARTIGGKKGTYYRDDIWSLLYLKGFKWHHLTDQISAENAERTSRMRAEISKAARENKEFVSNVERAKMLEGMQSKVKQKTKGSTDKDGGQEERGNQGIEAKPLRQEKARRSFKQISVIEKADAETKQKPEQVTRVLSKIF